MNQNCVGIKYGGKTFTTLIEQTKDRVKFSTFTKMYNFMIVIPTNQFTIDRVN